MVKKHLTKNLRKLLNFLRGIFFDPNSTEVVFYAGKGTDKKKIDEILRRLKYFEFDKVSKLELKTTLTLRDYLDFKNVVFLDTNQISKKLRKVKPENIFDLDYENNFEDGWVYHYLLASIYRIELDRNREHIKKKLALIKEGLVKEFDKAYIFGTGSSLEKAYYRNWNDGIRIVCNTIVKDKELWNHINPHIIVAADAIYHFGITDFSKAFRKDLAERLSETNTYFIFPEHFYPFVKKCFPQFLDRLIPIPVRKEPPSYNIIETKFELPLVGNVLNNLLLPVSCYLSKNIYLWGFDGRAPTDKLFWKNSDKHFYSDMVPQLQVCHPAFFTTHAPKDNPSQYVQIYHGDLLNNVMVEAEKNHRVFTMMHPSYTKTLMDRYKGEQAVR